MEPGFQGSQPGFRRATASALCAILVGIGLARFAYTPLIPALVGEGWFSAAEAAYLGAANLAGYLAGALVADRLTAGRSAAACLRWAMLLAAASLFACALPLGFAWFSAWRFVSGLCGGILMILAAPTVMPGVPPHLRGVVGGVIFTGVGLGIAASGTVVPAMLRVGLPATWCGLGALALLLTIVAWAGWPNVRRPARSAIAPPSPARGDRLALQALIIGYGLNAVGLVAHMVFLVDFIARGLEEGVGNGARYWILFGIGAILGPTVAGRVADRIGFALTIRLGLALQAVAVGLLAIWSHPAALVLSTLVSGAFVPACTALVLGRVNELVGFDPIAHRIAWRAATIAFSVGQAVAAYGYSYLFARTGGYGLLFGLGAAALALALLIELLPGLRERRSLPPRPGRRKADA